MWPTMVADHELQFSSDPESIFVGEISGSLDFRSKAWILVKS